MTSDRRDHYTLPLEAIDEGLVELAGRKAANLAILKAAGFTVPAGVVLSAVAFDAVLAGLGDVGSITGELIRQAPLPDEIAAALRGVAERFAGTPLAVRSSGVAEDLPGRSYAGQYETVLNVDGYGALVEAVYACWASAFSERVGTYGGAQPDQAPRMAVLIQPMVPAEMAGVSFSANPVTGNRAEVVVSAVAGLGDRLVSGEATPEEWIVRGDVAERTSGEDIEAALNADQALAVARLARKVSEHFGTPQDIEWAIAGDDLWLLQARPITTLPEAQSEMIPVPAEAPAGYWERDRFRPWPITPMQWTIWEPSRHRAIMRMARYRIADEREYRQIGGWTYSHAVPASPEARQEQIDTISRRIREDEPYKTVARWYDERWPDLEGRANRLGDVELAELSDEAFREHIAEVRSLAADALDIHFLATVAAGIVTGELGNLCQELLGWDTEKTSELLMGLPGKDTEPVARLAELARLARERPAVRQALDRLDDQTLARLPEIDAEFAAAVDRYRREFDRRCLSHDMTEPTLAEHPTITLRLIRDQLDKGFDVAGIEEQRARERQAVTGEARTIIAERHPDRLDHFNQALARGIESWPVRDDSLFYTSRAEAATRYIILELGRRLTERDQLAARDDIFFLTIDEALAALSDGRDRRADVARRRAERRWVLAHPGPDSYGGPPDPAATAQPSERTPVEELPEELRRALIAGSWGRVAGRGAPEGAPEGTLSGIAASAGRYTGPVRIVRSLNEFDKL